MARSSSLENTWAAKPSSVREQQPGVLWRWIRERRFARYVKIRIISLISTLVQSEIAKSAISGTTGAANAAEPVYTRNDKLLRSNIKTLGYQMARQLAAQRPITPGKLTSIPAMSKATCQSDVESLWFAYWCAQLKIPVTYHRKIWEYCYLLQTLHDQNLLVPGKRAIGFACGQEPIPSYLASRGISITATDLAPEQVAGTGWVETGQHASDLDRLWKDDLVARDVFDRLVSLKFVDMNAIPPSLVNYDFCWSICALEHVGSIAQGLDFIENSLSVLRPGGVAIHTTEYNTDNHGPTIESGQTVLFQRKHFESIAERLTKKGHWVAPLDFDFGDGPLDNFIDIPPYEFDDRQPAHLKLSIGGFACTCFGMVIRKKS